MEIQLLYGLLVLTAQHGEGIFHLAHGIFLPGLSGADKLITHGLGLLQLLLGEAQGLLRLGLSLRDDSVGGAAGLLRHSLCLGLSLGGDLLCAEIGLLHDLVMEEPGRHDSLAYLVLFGLQRGKLTAEPEVFSLRGQRGSTKLTKKAVHLVGVVILALYKLYLDVVE